MLAQSASSRNYDVCRLLLDHGRDIQNRSGGGGTALHNFSSPAMWEVLRRCGSEVDVVICDRSNRTILHYLAWSSQTIPADIKTYCEDPLSIRTSSIQVRDKHGCTPLHLAAQRGNTALMTYFISLLPASLLYVHDLAGRTPLHWAVHSRRAQNAIGVLLSASIEGSSYAQLRDCSGRTALHEAIALRNEGAITALLAVTGNEGIFLSDDEGITPLEMMRAWQKKSRQEMHVPCHSRSKEYWETPKCWCRKLHYVPLLGWLDPSGHL